MADEAPGAGIVNNGMRAVRDRTPLDCATAMTTRSSFNGGNYELRIAL